MPSFVKLEISKMSQKGDMSDDKNIRVLQSVCKRLQ